MPRACPRVSASGPTDSRAYFREPGLHTIEELRLRASPSGDQPVLHRRNRPPHRYLRMPRAPFGARLSDRLQTFSSENACATFGLHQVRLRAGFRFDCQVTVVSIGLPIEGAPLTGNVHPAPEKANRKSGTAPASAERPLFQDRGLLSKDSGMQLPGGALSLLNLA